MAAPLSQSIRNWDILVWPTHEGGFSCLTSHLGHAATTAVEEVEQEYTWDNHPRGNRTRDLVE